MHVIDTLFYLIISKIIQHWADLGGCLYLALSLSETRGEKKKINNNIILVDEKNLCLPNTSSQHTFFIFFQQHRKKCAKNWMQKVLICLKWRERWRKRRGESKVELVYSPPRPRYCFDSHQIVRYIKFDPKVLYKSLDFFFFFF